MQLHKLTFPVCNTMVVLFHFLLAVAYDVIFNAR